MYNEVESGCVANHVDGSMGCKDMDDLCSNLTACSLPEHNQKCCGCGGGTQYQCWSNSSCESPAALPLVDHSACVLDKTSDFAGYGYACVTQQTCSYNVRVECDSAPQYYWDYSPAGCCQIPPWADVCLARSTCTFQKVD
mmetsp:Transcript_91029/g.167141  ORF Transcript_91029/g.167141 Transcript_91029/m.167141 type:complete len:140 (+) Transcript_91029:1-420(+)